MEYKIWIVAPKEICSLFSAIWAIPSTVNSYEQAVESLMKLKSERKDPSDENSPLKYWIIFVLESYLVTMPAEDYKKLSSWALPAIISIPSHEWSSWYWEQKIRKIVEQAVGTDIFADK